MPEFSCPPNEICRPTFWNIPELIQIAIYIAAALVVAFFVYGFYRHVRVWRRGKGKFSFDQLSKRALNFLTFGVATRRVAFDKQPAGFMHLNTMWGIVILFVGTALATIDWEFLRLLFNARLLQDGFYYVYKVVLDIFGILALLGLSIALVTRYALRPKRLDGMSGKRFFRDDLWTLGAFFVLVLTGFMLESLRIAGMSLEWARTGRGALSFAQYSIVGNPLAQLWLPLGENSIRAWHLGTWLFHASLTLVWIAAIPFTKTFHIFSSSINTFFKRLEPRGTIVKIEKLEEQESFGVGKLEEFTWKQILDFDACTRCGRCQDACPAALTSKALSPKNIIVKLFEVAHSRETRAIHGEVINAQELWDCTTCMACVNACPIAIDQLGTIVELRRYLTLTEGAPQSPSNKAMDSMERQGNPYGLPKTDRLKWADGIDVPRAKAGEEYDVLFWVGCAGSYDQRVQKITRAFAKIMQTAGLKFAVMQEERCNCESARRLGNEYLYQTATAENIENLNKYSFKRIATTCPHCFNTIKNEYPQFDGKYNVVHHTQLIAELIGNGIIKPKKSQDGTRTTYHDSCYLGRYNDIYDPQRQILQSLFTNSHLLEEMPRSRADGLCCGGGGGRMWLEENTGTRINQRRIQDVLDIKAQTVASACPFCMTMLDDGAKALSVDEQLLRKDIAELVAEAL